MATETQVVKEYWIDDDDECPDAKTSGAWMRSPAWQQGMPETCAPPYDCLFRHPPRFDARTNTNSMLNLTDYRLYRIDTREGTNGAVCMDWVSLLFVAKSGQFDTRIRLVLALRHAAQYVTWSRDPHMDSKTACRDLYFRPMCKAPLVTAVTTLSPRHLLLHTKRLTIEMMLPDDAGMPASLPLFVCRPTTELWSEQ